MKIFEHPFNNTEKETLINDNTYSLILGSFPPYDIFEKKGKIDYFYGSNDNHFWSYFKNAFSISDSNFISSKGTIKSFLQNERIGVIDIIYRCYRKIDRSSVDKDLSIIEFTDMIDLLQKHSNIISIITTSCFVRDLLMKTQINPIKSGNIQTATIRGIVFELVNIFNRNIHITYLPSPSRRNRRNTEEEKISMYRQIFRANKSLQSTALRGV